MSPALSWFVPLQKNCVPPTSRIVQVTTLVPIRGDFVVPRRRLLLAGRVDERHAQISSEHVDRGRRARGGAPRRERGGCERRQDGAGKSDVREPHHAPPGAYIAGRAEGRTTAATGRQGDP
jgi:hypothetical protein